MCGGEDLSYLDRIVWIWGIPIDTSPMFETLKVMADAIKEFIQR